MSGKNIKSLQELLERLGFPGRTAWALEAHKESEASVFHVFYGWAEGEDSLLYGLEFQKEPNGDFRLDGYSLSLTRVEIPAITIRDIDALVLDENLKRVDQYYDFFLGDDWPERLTKQEYNHILKCMEATNAALEQLASWKDGKEVAKLLMYKYWPQSRYQLHFSDYHAIGNRYRKVQYYPLQADKLLTANQSYQLLKCVL